MKVWIDFANSPHPLFFAPMVRRLLREGHDVLLTARDNAQTVELARERWPDVEVIGGQSPKGRAAKITTMGQRIAALRRWAANAYPHVALSHNSYAQIVAARTLRIPVVTAMDFERQPVNHLAFRLAKTVVLPEVLPGRELRWQGARPKKVERYPGLKEELYIGDFEPDPAILEKVGLTARPKILAIARTPPSRAIYHRFANPLFEEALRTVCSHANATCIVLTRHPEQIAAVEALKLSNCIIPRSAIDSRSLLYAADLMIGAGGTMTREAALLGIPTWTLFAGTPPAVDRWLIGQGMLKRLNSPRQLVDLRPRAAEPHTPAHLRDRAGRIERVILDATTAAGSRYRR